MCLDESLQKKKTAIMVSSMAVIMWLQKVCFKVVKGVDAGVDAT